MASIFGHGIVGYTIGKLAQKQIPKNLVPIAVVSALLPDLDVIGYFFGVEYGSIFGHRGFTHSILFALFWAFFISYALGRTKRLLFFVIVFVSTLSHGILDAMTTGGRGVGFFIPFDNERFFAPFRFITVSPLGIEQFFTNWGLQVLLNELKYIFVPCLIILGVIFLLNRYRL